MVGGLKMRYLSIVTIVSFAAWLPVHAQEERERSVAKLVDLHGNVLVSRDTGLVSGAEKLRLVPGTRVITTAKADVVVEYDDGCRVQLRENQRFEVEEGKPCALLLAQDLLAAPLTTNVVPAVIAAAALAFGGGGGSSGASVGGQGGEIPISPN
jgi:hypothetical protein